MTMALVLGSRMRASSENMVAKVKKEVKKAKVEFEGIRRDISYVTSHFARENFCLEYIHSHNIIMFLKYYTKLYNLRRPLEREE
ncbi:hypothetical protein NC653_034167 [Populus alba x Populus x berolinensis]|uniref:Uncharacterized protein n=1 Tax=Populus alba x Populus x berolinensis TaxID=444605 RepID=A0AAD6PVW0_9ROSI|nr:hypothetical protein NC653_034167 [Populus alba x Populus x berolinensis]